MRFTAFNVVLLLGCAQSFSSVKFQKNQRSLTLSSASDDQSVTEGSRRSFINQAVTSIGFTSAGALTGNGLLDPSIVEPASAATTGAKKVNAQLAAFGLPPVGQVPDGLTPLLEIYGKGKNRFPILVQFNYPITWVVTTPSNDVNGEDGTIQAGEYAKGDTATFFVYQEPGNVKDLHSQPRELFEKALMRSIGQKGDNMYQNFKVTKLTPVTVDGKEYMLADFKYQLLTGAGFEVDRKGHASITSQGAAVEVLWAASTTLRYKKTGETLQDIVASFRCYTDGLNFSDQLIRDAEIV